MCSPCVAVVNTRLRLDTHRSEHTAGRALEELLRHALLTEAKACTRSSDRSCGDSPLTLWEHVQERENATHTLSTRYMMTFYVSLRGCTCFMPVGQ